MNYTETIEFLFSRLPMFHRIGAAAYKANLDNIIEMSSSLGMPHEKFRTIHVAGTNGKGSVSNMLSSVLQESGYKTGLFTSPHLKDFRERIRINGVMIPEKFVTEFVEANIDFFDDINPSFFEWTTALAFKYFADENVDIAVIETGLGGRLDSTNIITPLVSIITNISYDHIQLLGNTLEKIAVEKAGIIKKNIPVVIGERQHEIENVFFIKATQMNAPITFASDNYQAKLKKASMKEQVFEITKAGRILFEELTLDLPGVYQQKNICTVLQSLDEIREIFSIDTANITNGLRQIKNNTGLQGRWQVINENPVTIVDVAHNFAGINYIRSQLDSMRKENFKKLHIVFGMVNDKDPSDILSRMPTDAIYYFCKADLPRSMNAEDLKMAAKDFKLEGKSYISVADAYQSAREHAASDDLIFVGGSTFVVAEVL